MAAAERNVAMRAAVVLLLLCGPVAAFIGKDQCKEMACHSGQNNAPKAKWEADTKSTRFLGSYDYVSECEAACLKYEGRRGLTGFQKETCKSFVWWDEPLKPCLRKSNCWALQCHAVITDEWAPVDASQVISGRLGLAASSMVNKAFVSVSDGVSSMGNFTLGSTETVTLTPKEVRKAAAADAAKHKAAVADAAAKTKAEAAAKAKAEAAAKVKAAAEAAAAKKAAAETARRRKKAGKGSATAEDSVLAELVHPPIAFNILAVLILLSASAMVTDSSSRAGDSKPAPAPAAKGGKVALKAAAPVAVAKPDLKKSAPPATRSAPPAAAAPAAKPAGGGWFGVGGKKAEPAAPAEPAAAPVQKKPEVAGSSWFAAPAKIEAPKQRVALRSAPPPPPAKPAEKASSGWFSAKKEEPKEDPAPAAAARAPAPVKQEGGLFGIKLPELPELQLPDLGAAIGMGDEHEHKLKKLEESRKKAGAIDDDGAWLL